jgi:hypothetical protein
MALSWQAIWVMAPLLHTDAKTTASAIDVQSFREADCGGKSKKSVFEHDERGIEL